MSRTLLAGLLALVSVAVLGPTRVARADLSACGDIHVEAEATCEVVAPGVECEGMCTPVSVRAACAAKLDASCSSDCKDLPSVDCQGACGAKCSARCTDLDPGKFDCQADCKADCSGGCEGHCEAADNAAECEAGCTASCDGKCEGSCDVELPEADCDAGCEASCEGSCDVDANFDCQAGCQADGFAECETEIEGGCDIACKGDEGALFCDGQYVDHDNHLQECVDALKAALNITVETHAEGSCSGNQCHGSASAKITSGSTCTVSQADTARNNAGVLAFLGPAAIALLLRRARRQRQARQAMSPQPRA